MINVFTAPCDPRMTDEQVAEHLKGLRDAGLTHVLVEPHDANDARRMARLVKEAGLRPGLFHLPGAYRGPGQLFDLSNTRPIYDTLHTSWRRDGSVPIERALCPGYRGERYRDMLKILRMYVGDLEPEVVCLEAERLGALLERPDVREMVRACTRCRDRHTYEVFREGWMQEAVDCVPQALTLLFNSADWHPAVAAKFPPCSALYGMTTLANIHNQVAEGRPIKGGYAWVSPMRDVSERSKGFVVMDFWWAAMRELRAIGAVGVLIYPGPHGAQSWPEYNAAWGEYAKAAVGVFGDKPRRKGKGCLFGWLGSLFGKEQGDG